MAKNQFANSNRTRSGSSPLAAARLLIPCGGGTHARIATDQGANVFAKVGTDKFDQALTNIVTAGHGERLADELDEIAALVPGSPLAKVAVPVIETDEAAAA